MTDRVKNCAVTFRMDGKDYGFAMPAESFEDAERRMRAIRLTGRVVGWPCYSVRMPSLVAYLLLPFAPVVVFVLNLFRRKP